MATKGWSFGALTDALKSAAFLDAGQAPGQVVVVSAAGMATVGPGDGALTGYCAKGRESNDVYLLSNGSRAINGMVGSFQVNWSEQQINLGLIRGGGTDSLGYAFNMNGTIRHHYHSPSGQHRLSGDIVGSGRLVLGNLPNTYNGGISEKFSLVSTGTNEFTMSHQGRTWRFDGNGGIDATAGGIIAGNSGGFRCIPRPGGWEDWFDRAPAIQVDLQGSSASTGIRWTLWNTGHVAAIQAANTDGRNILRLNSSSGPTVTIGQTGNNGVTIDNAGLTVTGDVISNGLVRSGGASGAQYEGNGNIVGAIWGGNLYNWIATNAMSDLGRGGQQYYSQVGGNAWESPAGCVVTGRNSVANDGRNMGFYFRQLVGRKISGAQFAIGDFA